jgi:hypothetical protein
MPSTTWPGTSSPRSRYVWTARPRRSAAPRDRAAVRRSRPPDDPHALAEALSRVLAGQRPDPGPGRAYARQFVPSAAAALYIGAYRHLLANLSQHTMVAA